MEFWEGLQDGGNRSGETEQVLQNNWKVQHLDMIGFGQEKKSWWVRFCADSFQRVIQGKYDWLGRIHFMIFYYGKYASTTFSRLELMN